MKIIEKMKGYVIVSIQKDEVINVLGNIGSRFMDYSTKINNTTFKVNEDIIAMVNLANNNVKNIIDAIPYTEKYSFTNRIWTRLKRGCDNTNKESIKTVSGIVPFTRLDEFSIQKSNNEWYIVNKNEIGGLLEHAPIEHKEYKIFYTIKKGIGHYYIEPQYTTEKRANKLSNDNEIFYVTDDESVATKKLIEMNEINEKNREFR